MNVNHPDRSRNYRIAAQSAIERNSTFGLPSALRVPCVSEYFTLSIYVYLAYIQSNWKLSQVIRHRNCGQTRHTNVAHNCRVHLIVVLQLLIPQLLAVQWSHSKCPRGFHNIFNKLCSRCVATDLRIAQSYVTTKPHISDSSRDCKPQMNVNCNQKIINDLKVLIRLMDALKSPNNYTKRTHWWNVSIKDKFGICCRPLLCATLSIQVNSTFTVP